VWQNLHNEFQAHNVDVLLIGIDVDATACHAYMDKAPEMNANGLSLIDTKHQVVGELNFRNVPMAIWVNADGTVALPAHQSPVTPGWGDRPIPEGLPTRMAGRIEALKAGVDRHQDYLRALRNWVETGELPAATVSAMTDAQSAAAAAFELGDEFRRLGDQANQVACWQDAHRLDPNNWSAKRQAWTLVASPADGPRDLVQEETGPYEGNWLDDVVAVGGIANYYPPAPW
jgi:hypothetical protein